VGFPGLADALRKLAILPFFAVLIGAGLTLMSTLPAGGGVGVALLAIALSFRLPKSDFRLFVQYILGFLLFNGLRVFADTLGSSVSYAYPIRFDHAVFGAVPTVWLQDHLYHPNRISLVDSVTMAVYASYFKAHFIAAAVIWRVRRDLLESYMKVVLVTFALGLVGYFLVPTAPPWLASQAGDLPQVARIFHLATDQLWHQANENGTYIAGTNDVAAMPSLHTAITMTIALYAWRIHRVLGVLGLVYVALMGFSLMYLGEHYFADVLAGVLTGIAATALALKVSLALPVRSSSRPAVQAAVPETRPEAA
jgi:membrane-associated phospholipid phosphatase